MMPARLDAVHMAILAHSRTGPIHLKPLEGRVAAHTPLYRHAGQLRRWGLLRSPKKGLWEATQAGIRALEDAKAGAPENPLDARYPTLRLLPMPHQAIVRSGILSAFAREHRLREAHHPSLLVVGDTMSFKTTSARVLAYALGEDPTRAVVLTPSESGRSVSVRKTYGGKLASVRDALGWRFVAFDEYHKATPAVRTATVPYVMGQLEVPIENSVMSVRPATMIVMNPLKGKTIVESTGFGPAELRRMIPLFVSSKDVPEDVRFRGEKIVEAARKAGPIPMPTPAGVAVRAEDVAAILRPILEPEAEGLVDFETVAMLCEAMAAFASSNNVEFVIRDLLACYETVGWANPDWRTSIAVSHVPVPVASAKASMNEPVGKPVTVRDRTRAILARAGHVLDRGLDYHVKVQHLDALLRENGLDPAVTLNRVRATLGWEKAGFPWPVFQALYPVWQKTGDAKRFSGAIKDIVGRFGTFKEWEKTLAKQDAFLSEHACSWDDVNEAFLFVDGMREYGLRPADGRLLIRRVAEEAARLNLKPAEAVPHVLDAVKVHDDVHAAVKQHEEASAVLGQRLHDAQVAWADEVNGRKAERAKWRKEEEEREAERKKWEKEMAAWAGERERQEAARREREAENAKVAAAEAAARAAAQADTETVKREVKRLLGGVATIDEALTRAREREGMAEEARRAYEQRAKTLDAREAGQRERDGALDARDAGLRGREAKLEGQETAIEASNVALTLLGDAAGAFGPRAANALRLLANDVERGNVRSLPQGPLGRERLKDHILFLAKPVIRREYVPRALHERIEREVGAVKSMAEEMKRRTGEERGRVSAEIATLKEAVETYETWFKDPGKLSPNQAQFVIAHFREAFGKGVERTLDFVAGSLSGKPYCIGCHDYYYASLPTGQDLYDAVARGETVVLPHTWCGTANEFEPRTLLVLAMNVAFPMGIRRSPDGQ